jgi:hypothetical protein
MHSAPVNFDARDDFDETAQSRRSIQPPAAELGRSLRIRLLSRSLEVDLISLKKTTKEPRMRVE